MGYKARRVYVLEFVDLDGLEVRARSTTIDKFMDISALADLSPGMDFTDEDRAKIHELCAAFAECLVGWNLEDDDEQPIPATLDGLLSIDLDLVMSIVRAWLDAVASVSPPKGAPSPNGSRSVEGSLPMAPLSPSPPS
jgi:hypothetical protein